MRGTHAHAHTRGGGAARRRRESADLIALVHGRHDVDGLHAAVLLAQHLELRRASALPLVLCAETGDLAPASSLSFPGLATGLVPTADPRLVAVAQPALLRLGVQEPTAEELLPRVLARYAGLKGPPGEPHCLKDTGLSAAEVLAGQTEAAREKCFEPDVQDRDL